MCSSAAMHPGAKRGGVGECDIFMCRYDLWGMQLSTDIRWNIAMGLLVIRSAGRRRALLRTIMWRQRWSSSAEMADVDGGVRIGKRTLSDHEIPGAGAGRLNHF